MTGKKIWLEKKFVIKKNSFFIFQYGGGTVEELFAYIFRIYKKFGGNNPSILATTNSVSVATQAELLVNKQLFSFPLTFEYGWNFFFPMIFHVLYPKIMNVRNSALILEVFIFILREYSNCESGKLNNQQSVRIQNYFSLGCPLLSN